MQTEYYLPVNIYKDWDGYRHPDFKPSDRQMLVIEAVRDAREAHGLFYTADIYAHCAKSLSIKPEILAIKNGVEGGPVGMDFYYASQHIDYKHIARLVNEANDSLNPHLGMSLGTLVFQDYKRTTNVRITEMGISNLIVQGKRGAAKVAFDCNALALKNAMDRAFERKFRHDDFAKFCSSQKS